MNNWQAAVKRTALIMAGGKGLRMGSSLPKQFLLLNDKPVLMHTLSTFYSLDPDIRLILVLPEDQKAYWSSLCREYGFSVPHELVTGGRSRFESVRNGLAVAGEEGLIAIHDGVRPLVTSDLILRCFEAAQRYGAVIPVTPVIESLRLLEADGSHVVDREDYRLVQTPQTFQAGLIQRAYRESTSTDFTDDASVAQAAGWPIHLVEGERRNLKITEAADLQLAAWYLNNR
jgi:2-C-methyl-D-erythritol 4-phosphate cytidylyltransferase